MEQRSQCTVGPCRETLGRLLAGSNGVAVTHGQVAAILQRSSVDEVAAFAAAEQSLAAGGGGPSDTAAAPLHPGAPPGLVPPPSTSAAASPHLRSPYSASPLGGLAPTRSAVFAIDAEQDGRQQRDAGGGRDTGAGAHRRAMVQHAQQLQRNSLLPVRGMEAFVSRLHSTNRGAYGDGSPARTLLCAARNRHRTFPHMPFFPAAGTLSPAATGSSHWSSLDSEDVSAWIHAGREGSDAASPSPSVARARLLSSCYRRVR